VVLDDPEELEEWQGKQFLVLQWNHYVRNVGDASSGTGRLSSGRSSRRGTATAVVAPR